MRTLTSFSFMAALSLAAACSNASKDEPSQPQPAPETRAEKKVPTQDEKALEQEFAGLPDSVIIAVPVDSAGNEQRDQAEMRLQKGDVISDGNVESTFTASSAPAKVSKGELDADSSTQSWHAWQPSNNSDNDVDQSNATAVNISNIQNSDVDVNVTNNNYYNSGSGYYSTYRPWAYSTVWTGSYWGYSRPWCFQRPNIRYYVYPRRCWSFSFCRNHSNYWW